MNKLLFSYFLTFCIISSISCSEQKKNKLETQNLKSNQSKVDFPTSLTKDEIESFIKQNIKNSEIHSISFYDENIWQDSISEKIVYIRLNYKEKDKFGPFHYIYIFNPSLKKYKKIKVTASPHFPVVITFKPFNNKLKSLEIDYRIQNSAFMMIYGDVNNKFDRIFSWPIYDLNRYKKDNMSANYFDFSNNKNNFTAIDIYQGKITNIDLFNQNNRFFIPNLIASDKKIIQFFIDLKSMKYAAIPPNNATDSINLK